MLIDNERGFTVIELLVVMTITSVLLTLGAVSVRHFSMVQALKGAVDQVASNLRRAQTRSVSESHPLVYGAWFERGSSQWRLVRFDPKDAGTTTDDTCTAAETRSLGAGMFSSSVRISADSEATAFTEVHETSVCRSALGATSSEHQFVFFYARGTATAGKVSIEQPTLERTRTIDVKGLTGRVDAP